MPVVTPPVVDPNKIPAIIKVPTSGQTYNPVTPERLAKIAADWQTMSEPARQAATRNQAAALEAHRRIQERAAQKKAMDISRRDEKRDRIREALALQKRQEREYTRDRREFNRDLTQRQQQRLLQQSTLRTNRAERLKIQRANEAKTIAKQKADKRARDITIAQNRRNTQKNAAAENLRQAASWRKAVQGGKTTGAASARQYFEGQGANYAPYAGSVDQAIRQIAGTLNPREIPAASTFANVGQDVYSRLLNQGRTRAQSALQPHFGTGFEQRLLPSTAADETINKIQQEQFGEAQSYIDNLLSRGVIQQSGYDAALKNLQGQSAKVNTQLQDIGSNLVAGGQQKLTDIGNQAGQAAGNLTLGGKFNTAPYVNQTAQAIQNFQKGLRGQFDTQLQSGPLFDITGLETVAGKAQGPANTAFNPYALQNTAQPKNPLFDPAVGMKSVF